MASSQHNPHLPQDMYLNDMSGRQRRPIIPSARRSQPAVRQPADPDLHPLNYPVSSLQENPHRKDRGGHMQDKCHSARPLPGAVLHGEGCMGATREPKGKKWSGYGNQGNGGNRVVVDSRTSSEMGDAFADYD